VLQCTECLLVLSFLIDTFIARQISIEAGFYSFEVLLTIRSQLKWTLVDHATEQVRLALVRTQNGR